ncbi:MAG: tRNA 2-thiouridine(34) synthase MnmA, partial [archaeon]
IARNICKKLGVEYHIVDATKEFKKEVVDYFIKELKNNRTPNPCTICNAKHKFKHLFSFAKKHKINYVATGHYAKVKYNQKTKKYELLRPKDKSKDQTYGLCLLSQEWLSKIIFPLASFTKDEIYIKAFNYNFKFFLKKKQSQDFCYVSRNSLYDFKKEALGETCGEIVDEKANILGKHNGLYFYTNGQRINGNNLQLKLKERYYVKEIDSLKNRLIVTPDPLKIVHKKILISNYNFINGIIPKTKTNVLAEVRYTTKVSKAIIYPPTKDKKIKVEFKTFQQFITLGQFCAFYKGNTCLGGGVIDKYLD